MYHETNWISLQLIYILVLTRDSAYFSAKIPSSVSCNVSTERVTNQMYSRQIHTLLHHQVNQQLNLHSYYSGVSHSFRIVRGSSATTPPDYDNIQRSLQPQAITFLIKLRYCRAIFVAD